jgi:voltage-gated potassium channel
MNGEREFSPLKEKLHKIIFEADTPAGKYFDIVLLVMIFLSVITVMLETVPKYHDLYLNLFMFLEWTFTIVFTIEYLLRLYCVYKPMKYATSFYGIVDLISILPTYLSMFLSGYHSLMIIRGLRLLRVFRIFKLTQFLSQGQVILTALRASRAKIAVFMFFVMVMVSIFGSLMYLIEGSTNQGFDSIPRSIYWAIVTLTTVGYGDISPLTPLGQFLSSIIMIAGYAVIAVPTGIVSAEVIKGNKKDRDMITTQACRYCSKEGHDKDADYCKYCGEALEDEEDEHLF